MLTLRFLFRWSGQCPLSSWIWAGKRGQLCPSLTVVGWSGGVKGPRPRRGRQLQISWKGVAPGVCPCLRCRAAPGPGGLLLHGSSSATCSSCSQPYIVCRQCPEYRRQAVQPLPCPAPDSEPGAQQALGGDAPSASASFMAGETAASSPMLRCCDPCCSGLLHCFLLGGFCPPVLGLHGPLSLRCS